MSKPGARPPRTPGVGASPEGGADPRAPARPTNDADTGVPLGQRDTPAASPAVTPPAGSDDTDPAGLRRAAMTRARARSVGDRKIRSDGDTQPAGASYSELARARGLGDVPRASAHLPDDGDGDEHTVVASAAAQELLLERSRPDDDGDEYTVVGGASYQALVRSTGQHAVVAEPDLSGDAFPERPPAAAADASDSNALRRAHTLLGVGRTDRRTTPPAPAPAVSRPRPQPPSQPPGLSRQEIPTAVVPALAQPPGTEWNDGAPGAPGALPPPPPVPRRSAAQTPPAPVPAAAEPPEPELPSESDLLDALIAETIPREPPPSPVRAVELPPAPAAAQRQARTQAPPLGGPRPRVVVLNRRDGGVLSWLARLYAFTALVLIALLLVAAFGVYCYFSINAPAVPDLERYSHIAPGVSRVYAADGTIIGQFAKEWRQLVPFERIPPRLVNAFLAVEDHEFFEHKGLYFKGILRAVWRNVTAGDFTQGGSTITQQVAKQFLGSEKSLSRKGKEAVVARRLEARYSKRAILSVYLNHIYLGAGAWGVSAAAKRYFDKELGELTLAEAALIAGLAKAPTRFSPQNQPKLALERRNVVLDKMAAFGFATAEEVAAAKAEPIALDMHHNTYGDRMPYYGTFVRNQLAAKLGEQAIAERRLPVPPDQLAELRRRLGEERLAERGLRIETAAEPTWEAAAYENADYGARNQDKRQGWRGPEWRVEGPARELLLARQQQLYGAGPLIPGKRYLALVDKVAPQGAEVLIGDRRLQLPLKNMQWASKWQPGNMENDVRIDSATAALRPGYVVWVRREERTVLPFRSYSSASKNPVWIAPDDQRKWDEAHDDVVRLEQVPHPQTAIFTADHRTAYVAAMAGGHDYDRSVFNRAVQACRQPGSTYKPIYYSLALDQGYGFDTRLNDIPVTIVDPETGEKWTPVNLDDTLDSDVTLEFALVFSKNVPSLDLFMRLKAPNVEAWARRLGFTTKIYADEALALGASCSKLDELARAFTVFARNGAWWRRQGGREKSWIYVRRILDRDGNAIEDDTVPEDPRLPAADRLDRVAALAGIAAPNAIPPRAAFLMSKLLANEVTYGFANILRETKLNAAGKTGTSSATHDTTFVAYTSQWTTLVWMGDDKKERALGRHDAAYITVVPLWSRYMYEAARSYPNPAIPWAVPPGLKASDRGDHTKGERVPQMNLVWKIPEKPEDADGRPPI